MKTINNLIDYLFDKFDVWGAGIIACVLMLLVTSPLLFIDTNLWFWLGQGIGVGVGNVIGLKTFNFFRK